MTNQIAGVTELLQAWSGGEPGALDRLMPLVYSELHRIARRYMADEYSSHTLQASALINEAYVRLTDSETVDWKNRRHFYAVSAQIMRRILIDHARAKNSRKRAGGVERIALADDIVSLQPRPLDLVELDRALDRLAEFDPRKSQVIELRIFGGLTLEEAADVMDIALITVRRDWTLALAWLRRELEGAHES